MTKLELLPVHPGEILYEEFIVPFELSKNRLGLALGIPPQRIGEIVNGKRGITVDTALRLAYYFKTTPQFWLNLQNRYDLDNATLQKLPEKIAAEVRIPVSVA